MSRREDVDLDAVMADRRELEAWIDDPGATREIEEEAKRLMNASSAERLRGVRPELVERLRAYEPQAAVRSIVPMRAIGIGLAIAASLLIAVAFFPRRDNKLPPSGELAIRFEGAVREDRGAKDASRSRQYRRGGTVRIEVSQAQEEPVPATTLRVFEIDRSERIVSLPMRLSRVEDRRGTDFAAEASVEELFTNPEGEHRLVIVIAGLSTDPRELAGLTIETLRGRRDVRLFFETITIER